MFPLLRRSALVATSLSAVAGASPPASKRFMMNAIFGSGGSSVPPSGADSFYDLKEKGASGEEVDFEQFRGKVVYAVNVASR